jgi:pimeloyl-ACP methyl ester carboxylesterase
MQTIEVENGRLIAYEQWGDLGGRPIFQLHGTPGSRLSRHPDATLYPSLHLHVITIDRPGYGGSTALPGRRVSHAAHDVAAVADELGLDRFFVVGGSGGGPHALACAADLGDRVLGCAPVASAAPLIPAEIDGLLGINHKAFQVLADSGREGMVEFLSTLREHFLADPIGTLDNQLRDAPKADIDWSQREDVRIVLREAIIEALRPGVQGWADDSVSIFGDDWGFDLGRTRCPVHFWHSDDDKNGPLSSIERLVAEIPGASLRVWSGEGHTAPARHLDEILHDVIKAADRER